MASPDVILSSSGVENNNTGLECLNFTRSTAKTILALKVSFSLVAILTNLLVIGFIVCFKKTKDFIYRLVLYLMATDVFQAVAIILISLPVTVTDDRVGITYRYGPGNAWQNVCSGAGFISMVSLWTGNVIVIWIVLYSVWLGWSLYRQVHRKGEREPNIQDFSISSIHSHRRGKVSFGAEIFGIILLFLVPLIIASVPFSIEGGMYGRSGPWCWIKILDEKCGDLENIPFVMDIVFFYGPLMAIVVLTVIFVCATLTCCCRSAVRRHEAVIELKTRRIKAITIILACPVLYCAVIILLFVNRIYLNEHPHKSASSPTLHRLWLTHSIADPFRILIPALGIIFNPFVWKDMCHSRRGGRPSERHSKSKKQTSTRRHQGRMYGAIPVGNKEYVDSMFAVVKTTVQTEHDAD